MKRKWNMRLKILILCLGSTLAGLLLQTWLFQSSSSQLIYNQAKDESYRSMQNMQDDIYTFIKAVESGLIDLYNEKALITDLKRGVDIDAMRSTYYRAAYNLATDNFETSSSVVALYLYNSAHQNFSTYRRAVTPKHNYPVDIYDNPEENNADKVKEYFESDETQMMISSYYNQYRETDIVRFVLKLYNYVNINSKVGYVVCDIDSKALRKILEKYRVDEEMFIWMQPLGDRPILCTGNLSDSAREDYDLVSQEVLKGSRNLDNLQWEKKVFFAVYQDKYNLGAYSLMPRSLLNKNQKVLTENLLLITVIMLAVISISFYFVSRSLSRPLEEMTKTVKRIQAGETQLRMENLKEDEVGELGQSFNNMLDQIEGLIAKEYENKLLLNRAEYQALQAQINPHFLYNTLDTMSSIADIQNCSQVSALCQSLAGIFRYSLNMKEPFSTVAQEMVHLKNYIYVMNVRMQNQVEYEFEIEDVVLQDTLPRISIQPLVENAINHGLRNRKGEKKVRVSARAEDGSLVILVEDNGVGMTKQKIEELYQGDKSQEDKSKSIGILNIHRRMKLLYGEAYGVEIESEPDKGTRVYLRIPRRRQEGTEPWK
ncbi:sensor histidine kinase [Blautia schinkii]|nr:sensor histidine kinase [Blautia schinkii]